MVARPHPLLERGEEREEEAYRRVLLISPVVVIIYTVIIRVGVRWNKVE